MKIAIKVLVSVLVLGSVISLSACSITAPKTQFYSLTPISADAPPLRDIGEISLGVGPLQFPKLLNRPQIVTREANNKLELAEFHQWGGSLEEEFLQILTDNLSTLLATSRVYLYPWDNRKRPDYQARISVDQFDGELGEHIILRAKWQLLSDRGKAEIAVNRTMIKQKISNDSYDAYVAAQSKALKSLAEEITRAVPNQ